MGSLPLTVCSGLLVVAALGPAAQAAHAADGGTLVAAPAAPAPGAEVALKVSGCTGSQAVAASRAFTADARLTGTQGALSGSARVGSTVGPGAYEVKVTCADRVVNGRITIAAMGKGASAAPVDAAAHFATVATSGSGPDTAQAMTGLALASIAAVAVGLRTRRGRRTR
ncbi:MULTISPECIES: hypothetical protein [Streptomyces]|uniref:Lipoprotein n=1 Tax=Streptomyces griseofuscus TaxID=146922 RepID=A0A7H1Q4K3_9ACTN|nr:MULTISPECIES: hypothetical protein [Streptomyces]MBA9046033.1 hypothetical protein [Streptomyces murinus]QNT95233.1 hypothetical protein HEP81_04967 [Streptomyces griseofuscus]